MPELPEVETVVRGLRPILVGKTFRRVRSYAPPSSIVISRSLRRRKLDSALVGHTVESVDRRGKNILIRLDSDLTLWVHLKMTGKFRQAANGERRDKHDLVLFDFENNGDRTDNRQLRFNDYRRFGRLRLFPEQELWQQGSLRDIGPEPLELSAEDFVKLCRNRTRMIKPALMDQSFIAGIGNIYADESLHFSKIHPGRLTSSVTPKKLTELHGHIQRLLRRSIDMMGTTVISYQNVEGSSGSFQKMLTVYGKEGEPCGFCGGKIKRERMSSRSAHFCPRCQRPPRR